MAQVAKRGNEEERKKVPDESSDRSRERKKDGKAKKAKMQPKLMMMEVRTRDEEEKIETSCGERKVLQIQTSARTSDKIPRGGSVVGGEIRSGENGTRMGEQVQFEG